jgi:hypothetical protein
MSDDIVDIVQRLRSQEKIVLPAGTQIAIHGGTIETIQDIPMQIPAGDRLEAAAEIERARSELERRTKWHLKVLKELARGECEVAHVSDNGDMTVIFPRALYESQYSHPGDHHLIDLITSDPAEKQARAVTPQADGLEENRRKIWRARLAQMRRVGIVISEAKS